MENKIIRLKHEHTIEVIVRRVVQLLEQTIVQIRRQQVEHRLARRKNEHFRRFSMFFQIVHHRYHHPQVKRIVNIHKHQHRRMQYRH